IGRPLAEGPARGWVVFDRRGDRVPAVADTLPDRQERLEAMRASDRPKPPGKLKPWAKPGVLLGGVATVAMAAAIVTTARAQPPRDAPVRQFADRRDHLPRGALRQESANALAEW